MANKTIRVNLQFNADTENAKKQIASLQQTLNTAINNGAMGKLGVTNEIQQATRSAMDLKIALNNATNVDTGKLNLNKFQSELKRSGRSIGQYAQQLKALGPAGVQAFNQMASAVASADTKLISLSGGMKKLTNTLFNTMRWSVASAAIQGVTSAISDTVNYAKELDTSLNNIRIVTGKSAEEMARFAKEANKMAKQLATTTTKYSDASLIYYQQGLSSKEVKERTDVTVKLANVVGENAQTVSEWMTAIWNNFDDGSRSLEAYADVLAKLGAATASSADEIAGGLEKFAAVADTIGLSYEYAASMLATITAETRQSEDVVGTALKTILSRMEQLNQGEMLDDGTTLGKYSLALQKVGVDIKNSNGELKDMDVILDQTGQKWDTLARDQQIALAQSVAGIRQYTQFMALMDNWDVMEKNLRLTEASNGALQEQQEIYEDSLEAAENRMTASAEKVKSTLLDADGLKPLYNFASGSLEVINELLEAFGGLPTILLAVAAALTKIYQPQVASFFSQMAIAGKDMATTLAHPIKALKGENVTQADTFKAKVIGASTAMNARSGDTPGLASIQLDEQRAKETLLRQSNAMTASAKQRAEWELEGLEVLQKEVSILSTIAEKEVKRAEATQSRTESSVYVQMGEDSQTAYNSYAKKAIALGTLQGHTDILADTATAAEGVNLSDTGKKSYGQSLSQQVKLIEQDLKTLGMTAAELPGFQDLANDIEKMAKNGTGDIETLIQKIRELQNTLANTVENGAVTKEGWISTKLGEGANAVAATDENVTQKNALDTAMGQIDQANLTTNIHQLNEQDIEKTGKLLQSLDTSKMDKASQTQIKNWKDQHAQIEKLQKSGRGYKRLLGQLNKEIASNSKNTNKNTGVLKQQSKALGDNLKKSEGVTEEVKASGEELAKSARLTTGAENAVSGLSKRYDEFTDKLNNGGFSHWSDTLASGLSAITSYAMGLSMLSGAFENLFKGIAEGNLTFGDFLSSMTSILMSASMVIPSIIQMTNLYRQQALAKQAVVLQERKEQVAQKLGIGLDAVEIMWSKIKQKETKKEILTKQEEQVANIMTGISGIGKQAGQGPKGWISAAISAAMLIPIAAMIGVGAISGISAGHQSEAEMAAEEEETLKGQADEKKQEYDDFKSALSDYKDAQENIDKLTEGTQEWTEALMEANAQIVDLLGKYPELAQFISTTNGRMTISDEGWTYVSEKLMKQAAIASTMTQAAGIRTQEAQLKEKSDKFIKDNQQSFDLGGGVSGTLGVNQAFIDELWSDYSVLGEKAFLNLEERIKELGYSSDNTAEGLKQIIREQKTIQQQEELLMKTRMNNLLGAQLGFNTNILTPGVQKFMAKAGEIDLANATDAAGNKIDFSDEVADNIAANWYSPILDVVGGLSVTATAGTGSSIIGGVYAANRNKLTTSNAYATDTGWSVYATDRGKQTFQEYATAMGLKVDEDSINFKGNHVTYKLKDGDSDEEIKVSYDTLLEYEKQAFLEARAADYTKLAQTIYSTSNELLQSDSSTDQAIGEYLASGDIQALDVETFRELKEKAKEPGGLVELLENSAEGIEFLDEIGLSAEQIAADIEKQLNSLSEAEVISNRIQRDRQAYNDTIASGAQSLEMDANVLKAYAEHLADANDELEENTQVTADVAVEHFKMSKGLIELRKTLKDNIDTLQSASKNSLEYAEALGAIKTSVDKVFGTNVSFEFIEENLSQIQSMLDGSVESYNKVRKGLVSDWVQHLALDDSSIKEIDNLFSRLMDRVDEGAPTIEIGVNDKNAINTLNDLVRKGQITSDELEGIFKNANLAWDSANITYYDLPQGTSSTSTIKVTNPDGTPGPTYQTETYNETKTQMPWIGDNPPNFQTFSSAEALAHAQDTAETGQHWVDTETGEKVTKDNWELGKVYKRADSGKVTNLGTLKTQQNYVTSDVLLRDGEDNETAAEQKKRWKELDAEIDRYHEIDELIQDIERDADKLAKAKDRAFGAGKLTLMQQEIDKQKELLELSKKRRDKAEEYHKIQHEELLSTYEVELDSAGRITNYTDLIQAQINKMKGMSETDADYKKEADYLKQMQDDFSQYEETLDELNDEQQNVIDKQYELQDLAMEKIEYTVQIKVDAADGDLARIDFLMQTLEDDAFKAAEAIGLLGESAQANIDKYSAANEGYKDTQRAFEAGEISAQQAADALRQYRDDMIEANAELLNLRTTVQDKLTEAFDAWNEKLDKNAEKFDFYGSIIDNYKNIVDIVGKDNFGVSDELLKQMNQASVDNANNALKASKSKLEANEKYLESLRQKRMAAEARGDTESVKEWDKQIEYAEEQVRTAAEEFNDSWSNALEATAEAFSTHVDSIIENFSESVAGVYKNLEQLQEAFDRQTEINDRYLEQYEKTYEINKLNRSIQNSIDKTDNVGSQKELRKLQQELLALNEAGVDVSQRDIEYMQKKYDLMVAEQALKDAQNAKSIVRLQRDSEGNFGYVYTADQANVDNAQQNYEDKLYAMQKFGDESLQEISEQTIAINVEFAEAIKAIEEDAALSWEEKQVKIAEVTEYYTGKLQYWTEEGTKFLQYGKEMNTEYNTGMAQSFHDTTIGSMYPDMESFRDLYTNSQSAMTIAGNNFIKAIEQHELDIDKVMGNAGTSVDTFAKDAKDDLDIVQKESEDTAKAAQELADAMDTDLNGTGGALDAVEAFQLSYSGLMEDIRNDTKTTIGKIGELLTEYEKLAKAAGKDYAPKDLSGNGANEGDGQTATTTSNTVPKPQSPKPTTTPIKINDSVIGGGVDWKTKAYGADGKTIWRYDIDTKKFYSDADIQKSIDGGDGKYRITYKEGAKGKTQSELAEEYLNAHRKIKVPGTGTDDQKWISYATSYNQINAGTSKFSGYNGKYFGGSTFEIVAHSRQKYQYYNSDWETYVYKLKGEDGRTYYVPLIDLQQINPNLYTAANLNKVGTSFDTGGYTGSWGPEGRLAMLHQKEIVLNAHDTANLLTAVDIVRSMADKLEMNASIASQGIAGLTASIAPYHGGDTLEQNVTIHAEFPNATNHSEIEEAFGNLVNLASQYANRK